MLTVSGVTKRFGGLTAVDDIDLNIESDEVVGLIGPNGAGKTTLFNTIAGVYTPETGSITFQEEELVGKKPYEIARYGISRTFQTARTFNELTALENVLASAMFGKEDSQRTSLFLPRRSYPSLAEYRPNPLHSLNRSQSAFMRSSDRD